MRVFVGNWAFALLVVAVSVPHALGDMQKLSSAAKDWLGSVYNTFFAAAKSECQRLVLQECTCFEVLQLNSYRVVSGQSINIADIKKGYHKASKKFYHPDKGGSEQDFQLLQACYENFKDPEKLDIYLRHVETLEKRKHSEQWGEEKFRDRIDQLNEMLLAGDLEAFTQFKPPQGMHDPQIDRLFLFLDDSGSMILNNALSIGHDSLISIEDRVDRTPTSVHFIGTKSFVKFRFDDEPDVMDILPEWKGQSGGTQLWEYVYGVLLANKRPPGSEKDEVVVLTDGLDNKSSGSFNGIEGFSEMMKQLIANGVSLRISVLCIGNEDMCKVSQYQDLARATGGAYANVDPDELDEKQRQNITAFAGHVTASNARRAELEIEGRKAHEQACIAGTAKELTWYTKLADEKASVKEKRENKGEKVPKLDSIDL